MGPVANGPSALSICRFAATCKSRGLARMAGFLLAALLAIVSVPLSVDAQGMSANRKTALPPMPLPEGADPPSVNYRDVARAAGLAHPSAARLPGEMTYLTETTGTGVGLIDFDRDGLLDIFLIGSGISADDTEGEPHRMYRNLGGLRFRDVGEELGLAPTGWGQGVCAGDFDDDGFVDLFVTHWGPDVLLRNQGGKAFQDEPLQRGVAGSAQRWSTGCSFLDFDRDGDLDLFVAHYVDFDPDITPHPGDAPQCAWKGAPIPCGPRGLAPESMSLFANDGEGQFSDVSGAAGITTDKRYHGLGVIAADLDGDGWTDIFVACDSTANLLFKNLGDGRFEEVGLLSAAAYNEDGNEQAGMGVAAADYDGDGWLDLFQTNFADDTNTLYRNRGRGMFRDRTVSAGMASATRYVGWGAVFLDFDHDGWPDIFAVNGHVAPSVDSAGIGESFAQPRMLFWNRGDGIFHPLSASAGAGVTARHPSRGAAAGDLDNDGDLEIVVVNIGEPPSLLQNQVERNGNWLAVRALSRSGSDAIGAKVSVILPNRTLTGEIRSGDSYLSQSDFRLHFGLGDVPSVGVDVEWLGGHVTARQEVVANQVVTLREDAGR